MSTSPCLCCDTGLNPCWTGHVAQPLCVLLGQDASLWLPLASSSALFHEPSGNGFDKDIPSPTGRSSVPFPAHSCGSLYQLPSPARGSLSEDSCSTGLWHRRMLLGAVLLLPSFSRTTLPGSPLGSCTIHAQVWGRQSIVRCGLCLME